MVREFNHAGRVNWKGGSGGEAVWGKPMFTRASQLNGGWEKTCRSRRFVGRRVGDETRSTTVLLRHKQKVRSRRAEIIRFLYQKWLCGTLKF